MNDAWKFIILIVLLALAGFASAARLFAVSGVTPSLVFLLYLLFFFRTQAGRRLTDLEAVFTVGAFLLFAALVLGFWFAPAAILAGVILLAHFFGRRVTGNALLDMLVSLVAGTLVFYAAAAVLLRYPFPFLSIGLEILLTAALGVILWWPLSLFTRE